MGYMKNKARRARLMNRLSKAVDEGATIYGLAKAIGISESSLHRLVHNERIGYKETWDKISDYFRRQR